VLLVDEVAEGRVLPRTADDVVERDAAHQTVVLAQVNAVHVPAILATQLAFELELAPLFGKGPQTFGTDRLERLEP
jgi:hypothetical protein